MEGFRTGCTDELVKVMPARWLSRLVGSQTMMGCNRNRGATVRVLPSNTETIGPCCRQMLRQVGSINCCRCNAS
jgi:hypothetical protein